MKITTPACLALLAIFATASPPARAETFHHCTGFIETLPATITTQGTWCMYKDLGTGISSGAAITLANSNITIDCNDYKLGGLAAGVATQARAIAATNRASITVRNCNVRGFYAGVHLDGGHAHRVFDSRFDGNTVVGIYVAGDSSLVRDNLVTDTGGAPGLANPAGIHVIGSVDVIDNLVDGVFSAATNGGGVGIRSFDNYGGSIAGNRVRGLTHSGTSGISNVIGIGATGTGVLDVHDNVLVGDGAGYAISCSEPTGVRFRDNALRAFATIDSDCFNAGGNDIAP